MAGPFRGWTTRAMEFYDELAADNTKAFWTEHKAEYDELVRGPMEALADEVRSDVGPLQIFRPYRDVRFSKDKTPYKTHIGARTEGEGGETYYVALSAEGLRVGGGYYHFAPDQLERYRAAIDDEARADELDRLAAAVEKQGFTIGGQDLKTAPRGVARDHHHIRWMRHKRVYVWKAFGTPQWLGTRRALKRITDAWHAPADLYAWLATHVGPSDLPPDESAF